MNDAQRLAGLIELWRVSIADFVELARDLPRESWDLPTDLPGWSVKDNVAHTAHLEAVLAGGPEETMAGAPATPASAVTSTYTERGVLARRDHDMATLCDEIEQAAAARLAALEADPPTDAAATNLRTPAGLAWSVGTLLSNRPLDVWMHEQDIRRAVGRPGGFDSPAAAHVVDTLLRALPMVVGKRVAPPVGTTVVLEVSGLGRRAAVTVGQDGRAARSAGDDPTTTITLTPEDFVCAAGGRRPAAGPQITGDAVLGHRVLAALAVTP